MVTWGQTILLTLTTFCAKCCLETQSYWFRFPQQSSCTMIYYIIINKLILKLWILVPNKSLKDAHLWPADRDRLWGWPERWSEILLWVHQTSRRENQPRSLSFKPNDTFTSHLLKMPFSFQDDPCTEMFKQTGSVCLTLSIPWSTPRWIWATTLPPSGLSSLRNVLLSLSFPFYIHRCLSVTLDITDIWYYWHFFSSDNATLHCEDHHHENWKVRSSNLWSGYASASSLWRLVLPVDCQRRRRRSNLWNLTPVDTKALKRMVSTAFKHDLFNLYALLLVELFATKSRNLQEKQITIRIALNKIMQKQVTLFLFCCDFRMLNEAALTL